MEPDITIQRATLQDFERVLAFYNLIDPEFFPPLSQRFCLTDKVQQAVGSPGETCYMAIRDGKIVAVMSFERNIDNDPAKVYLKFFGVRPDCRKSGIGITFRREVLERMRTDGIKTVTTRTWSTNHDMLALNRKLGFEIDRVITDDRGPGVDTIYFVKRFE